MDVEEPKTVRSKAENIPREIFLDIFLRLPLKSVIRSSCVSKSWLSIIKDPSFVKLYTSQSIPDPSVLIVAHRVIGEKNIISICPLKEGAPHLVADEIAIDHMVSSFSWDLVGTCCGLLCFTSFGEEEVTMVCNPVTREHITLPKPAIALSSDSLAPKLAFGFDPVARKYKVIRVIYPTSSGLNAGPHEADQDLAIPGNHAEPAQIEVRGIPHDHVVVRAAPRVPLRAGARVRSLVDPNAFTRAEVYTLGTDSWRIVQGFNHHPYGNSVHANGVVYWLVDHPIPDQYRILSFDLGTEQFKLTPHRRFGRRISLAELGGCLAVVDLSSARTIEISILRESVSNCWELAYIIPVDKPRSLAPEFPRLICVFEHKDTLLLWLQDCLLLYDRKSFKKRYPKIRGFPTLLDWEICSGYGASLVPISNSDGTRDDRREVVRFICDSELDALRLQNSAFGGQKAGGSCDRIVTSFYENGMLI